MRSLNFPVTWPTFPRLAKRFSNGTGTRAIFGYLQGLEAWEHGKAHRRRFLDHRDAREADAPGRLVEYFRLPPGPEPAEEPVVVHVPEASRYELRDGDRMVGEAAYRRRIIRRYLALPMLWHRRHATGTLLANASSDAEAAWAAVVPLPFAVGTVVMLVAAIARVRGLEKRGPRE